MDKKITFRSDVRLSGVLTRPQKTNGKAVILCHGITVTKDESGAFIELAKRISKEGYTVLRFDFRGHGESEMAQEEMTLTGEINDVSGAVDYMQTLGFKKVVILGASFGGGATTMFTSQNQDKVSLLLLWNPCLDYDHSFFKPTMATRLWIKDLFTGENEKLFKEKGYVLLGSRKYRMGKKLITEMKHTKPYEYLKEILIPVVFFHGTGDAKVDFNDSVNYSKLTGGEAKLILYKDFEHGFHPPHELPRVLEDTIYCLNQFS